MDAISNVDRLVLVLRQKLQERSKSAGSTKSASAKNRPPAANAFDSVQALAAVESISDPQLKRVFVQSLLVEQFGSQLINEAKFQQVVERVSDTLQKDPKLGPMLTKVVGELRRAARPA